MTEDIFEDQSQPLDFESLRELAQEMQAKIDEDKQRRMDALQKKIADMRDEAVRRRKASGIEKIWEEDNEYYEGIDDYNRDSVSYLKPHYDGPLQPAVKEETNQSTAFFNITRQFVDSAAARAGDILLPAGDWNWGVKKTPIGEDITAETQTVYDQAAQDINAQKVKAGERRIKDWLAESRYHREYRKALEKSARIGTGVIRGPYPFMRTKTANMGGQVVTQQEIIPGVKAIDPENCFPDPNCGDDIHNGDYFVERDYLTHKQLNDLKSDDSYFADAIAKVLKEGPKHSYQKDGKEPRDSDLFEVWFFVGNVDMNDMDLLDERFDRGTKFSLNEESGEIDVAEEVEEKDFQPVIVVMVNSTIIKAMMNPLESGKFPYRVLCWQRRDNLPWGIGVARQMRIPQQMLLSSARNLIDNMAISSVPMLALRQQGITPADGKWEITKGKVWWLTDENIRTINEAIQYLELPTRQKELTEIIMLAGKMAEDATGVNSLLQGQQGAAPDTVGGMELLHKNASALLRRIARICDEEVTEPLIIDFYEWLLFYGNDEEKGDFDIEAFGSSILVEREIQEMQAQTLLQYAQDPSYGLSKSKIMTKIVDSWGFDSTSVMMDDQEKQQLAEQAQQQQPDPRMAAAQLQAQTQLQIAEMRTQVDQMRIQKDTDRDALYAQGVSERNQMTYQAQIEKLQLERELELLKYANTTKDTLDNIKAKLSSEAMKLAVTKELAALDATADKLPKPVVEPPQQAQTGNSFQQ